MMRLLQGRYSPIGVDLGRSAIRMLQFRSSGKGLAVQASGHYRLPADLPAEGPPRRAALLDGCRKILDSAPFHGHQAVSGLAVEQLQFKNVRLPKMPPAELQQAVRWEVMERLQLGDQPHLTQFLVAGEIRQGEEVRDEIIAIVAAESILEEHLGLLTECGLSPLAIDAPPTALARCFARQFRREADQKTPRMFVDVGMAATKVIIVQGPAIRFFKSIDIGGMRLNQAIAEHLNMSLEDAAELRRQFARRKDEPDGGGPLFGSTRRESAERALSEALRSVVGQLSRELGLCMRYYSVTFRGHRPEQIFVCGGEAGEPELVQMMAEELEVPVRVAQPLAGVDLSDSHIAMERRGDLADWAMACGLALRPATHVASVKRGAA